MAEYISPAAVLSVVGIAAVCEVIVLWIKRYLPDWRWTSLVTLGIGVGLAVLAQIIIAEGQPTATQVFEAVMTGFFGASAVTLVYEGVQNVRGLAGKGARSDEQLDAAAYARIGRIT